MSRINLSNLNAGSEMSREEMSQTVGGLRVVCGPEVRITYIRGPFGIKIPVPRVVVVCRVRR